MKASCLINNDITIKIGICVKIFINYTNDNLGLIWVIILKAKETLRIQTQQEVCVNDRKNTHSFIHRKMFKF